MTTTPLIRHREPIRLEVSDAKISIAVRMVPGCKEVYVTFNLEGADSRLHVKCDERNSSWRKMHLIPGDYVVSQIGFEVDGKQLFKSQCHVEGSDVGGWLSHVTDELAKERAVESKALSSANIPSTAVDLCSLKT